ncbi:hypothetical protein [Halorubellus litoreus]|uniref:DUF4352 domain-containing protein n=1 Tax=Halorubellus litoreus TaxID=755308 RepID=A0ABD5VKT8_9EURY
MLLDFIAGNWNDALTVLTAGVAAYTAYHQIQYYRAQQASLNIISIDEPTYEPRAQNAYGDIVPTNEIDETELRDTKYSLEVVLENDGREPTTLSEFTLSLPDTEEELFLYNDRTRTGWQRSFVEFEGNERKQLNLFNSGEVRDTYGQDVEAILCLDSTADVIEQPVMLRCSV